MRLKLIACKIFTREFSSLIAQSPHCIDVTYLKQGFHEDPDVLRQILQQEIDAIESGTDAHTNAMSAPFDAILLGYGLCSNATCGITAQHHKLVIPRAHDCITMFFGSKESYKQHFDQIPGCYWYTSSWIENAAMPCEQHHHNQTQTYEAMGYDEETIEFLLEEINGLNNYHNAAYIQMPSDISAQTDIDFTREAADFYGWNFHLLQGSMNLMEHFINGNWNDEEFLVLEPGETAAPSYDSQIIKRKSRSNTN